MPEALHLQRNDHAISRAAERFEASLLRHGVLTQTVPLVAELRAKGLEGIDTTYIDQLEKWVAYFAGQVPAKWVDFPTAHHAFHEAAAKQIQLRKPFQDAGITHPHYAVALTVGQTQRLDTEQMATLFAHRLQPELIEVFGAAQQRMGVATTNVEAAVHLAEAYHDDPGRYVVENPLLRIVVH